MHHTRACASALKTKTNLRAAVEANINAKEECLVYALTLLEYHRKQQERTGQDTVAACTVQEDWAQSDEMSPQNDKM